MARQTGRKRRSFRPRFTAKDSKSVGNIRTNLSKDLWVSGAKAIANYRNELLLAQGGVCAISGEAMASPCLDHDHFDGKCRGVIGSTLNLFEGQVQKLWSKHMEGKTQLTMSETLRRLADYLEEDKSDFMLHGEIISDLKTSLKRWTRETISRNFSINFGGFLDPDLDKSEMITEYVRKFVEEIEKSYLWESKSDI